MPTASEHEPPHSGRRPTLVSLARDLEVSKATVSNAFNRPDQLSADLRERILTEARRQGYRGPDAIAATFSRRRAGALGLLFDDPLTYALTDPAQVLLTTGIGEVCEDAGLGLVLVGRGPDLIHRALVDGFICHSDDLDDDRIGVAIDRGLPIVIVDGPARPGASRVGIDDRAAATLAADHLTALGHREVGVLCTPLRQDGFSGVIDPERQADVRLRVSADRLAGYRDGLTSVGVDWETVPVAEAAPYGRIAGYHAATTLLAARPDLTAVLAMSDELALGAYRAAEERGLTVGTDLSIIGFDDAPPAAWANPPLTTIAQPHRDKGRTAARLLVDGEVRSVSFPTTLVTRSSTATRR